MSTHAMKPAALPLVTTRCVALLLFGACSVAAAQTAPPGSPVTPVAPPSAATPTPVTRSPARPLDVAPALPGRDGLAPRPRPVRERAGGDEEDVGVPRARTGGDEEDVGVPRARTGGDEEDVGVPRARTAGPDEGGGAATQPLRLPATQTTPVRGIQPAVGAGGGPIPLRPGAARATGGEDEMEDLDIQRRTAPGDLGDTPLPTPGAPLQRRKASPGAGLSLPAGGVQLPAGAVVAPAATGRPEGVPPAAPPPPARATVQAPPRAKAGDFITVTWAGPGRNRDYIVVALPDALATTRESFAYANAYNPGPKSLRLPTMPGPVEVRYIDEATGEILARVEVQVVP